MEIPWLAGQNRIDLDYATPILFEIIDLTITILLLGANAGIAGNIVFRVPGFVLFNNNRFGDGDALP